MVLLPGSLKQTPPTRSRRAMTSGRHTARRRGRSALRVPKPWFTRVRALLAGAIVLGVGATLTLAAWTDQEVASGSFTASTFGLQGAVNGGVFSEHSDSGSAATLTFSDAAVGMSPGSVKYVTYSVRTTSATSVAGTVTFVPPAFAGELAPVLRYGVSVIPTTTCNAGNFAAGTIIVAAGSVLTQTPSLAQPLAATGASQTNYCIAVNMVSDVQVATNAYQGKSANGTWTFTATSVS